ncbi:MAG: N-acetylneuraminate synthase family protein [Candidatus Adiutrix sp.]|jgi:sialic acid synthase SpsE|nr:N-acetylneuraminate synthase family protein [Candidatus Adiutrix sp.]
MDIDSNISGLMMVDTSPVGAGGSSFLVAEIGGNHGGNPVLAAEMVRAAAAAGAEAVKFQAYRTADFLSPLSPYYDELAAEELPFDQLGKLVKQAHGLGLAAGLTVFDAAGIAFAQGCGADFLKISSGDLTHPYLPRRAAETGLPLFLSTGAAEEAEVSAALAALGDTPGGLVIMQCAALYPAPAEAANLAVMRRWQSEGLKAGYSDHTLGLNAAKLAVAMGAAAVEKHFTTDRNLPGGDNSISATPEEFNELVRWRNTCGVMLGQPVKRPHPLEVPMRPVIRRALVAGRPLCAGDILAAEDVKLQRPPSSTEELLAPDRLAEVVGRCLTQDVPQGAALRLSDLERA